MVRFTFVEHNRKIQILPKKDGRGGINKCKSKKNNTIVYFIDVDIVSLYYFLWLFMESARLIYQQF